MTRLTLMAAALAVATTPLASAAFAQALKMPTRAEAVGRVLQLALSPASRLVGQLLGPAGRVCGQVKSKGEEKEGEDAPAEAAATA